MDETAIAFEMPHVRAASTSGSVMPDRISVRDYTRAVEIGAFRSERGVLQRVRFNVVLEVAHHAAAEADDVDQVISYDTITEAIEAELAAEHVNLLETLAERVAARCLADPRALRVFVRIEKLDRIPGALGVEIARRRVPGAAARLHAVSPSIGPEPKARAFVAYLGAPAAEARAWRDALVASGAPLALCLPPLDPQARSATEAGARIGLLSIEQAAWALTGEDARFSVAGSRTEIDWSLKAGHPIVWAPSKLVTDARERPDSDASDPAGLAAWLAREIGATGLIVIGGAPVQAHGLPVLRPAAPSEIAGIA